MVTQMMVEDAYLLISLDDIFSASVDRFGSSIVVVAAAGSAFVVASSAVPLLMTMMTMRHSTAAADHTAGWRAGGVH